MFWNVAGLRGKDEEFWEFVESFDVVGLTETWVEEKDWEGLERKMPKGWSWCCQGATKEERRGRARGGIITGVRKELGVDREERREVEGAIERKVKIGGEVWRIVTVYNRGGRKEKLKEIDEKMVEDKAEVPMVIGGDFNARIGVEGGQRGWVVDGKEEVKRTAMDKVKNREGQEFVAWVEEKGWSVLNGNKEGDEQGRWTFGRGESRSTIDYAVVNEITWDEIEKFVVIDRAESDHQPIEVVIRGKGEEWRERKARPTKVEDWSDRGRKRYGERVKEGEWKATDVEGSWVELKETVIGAVERKVRKEWKMGKQPWWDRQCRKAKKELQKEWEKYNKRREGRKNYEQKRKEYKELCGEKKRQYTEREEEELGNIKNESEAWAYVNKGRRKGTAVSGKIGIEDWKAHFVRTLEGTEEESRKKGRGRESEGKEAGEGEEEERGPSKEEIRKIVQELKDGKASGADGIRNEAWKFGGERIINRLTAIIEEVWRGKGYPEEWRDGVIIPIHKKGDREKVGNYRGITLTSTAYKVYATWTNKRLEEEMTRKKVLEDVQVGFRKGRGAMDNIYIVSHVIDKRIKKKRGKAYMVFIDLSAAFDKLDREILWKTMRKRGIEERTVRRVREIYKETRCTVRVGEEESERFWVTKGVRQGCPLSPTLFNIYVSDLEETLRKGQDGGVVIGKRKIWSLGYADDIVLMAENEQELERMMDRARRYFERKKLIVNEEKTKVMVFGKGGGRRKKKSWRWGEKEIEEVNRIVYLGYELTRGNNRRESVMARVKKAKMALGRIWSIGERKFRGDIKWRLKLFDAIVRSILMYGVEVWGWREWEEVERIQERYIRWILGVDRTTPGYVVREELKREKMRVGAGRRATKYEEKIRGDQTRELLRGCWEEGRKEEGRGRWTKWGMERREYYWRCGVDPEEAERRRKNGAELREELVARDREVEVQERRERIRVSRGAEGYEGIMVQGWPRYTKGRRGRRGDSVKVIARLRCGNEGRVGRYWEKEEKRKCRTCGEEKETIEHLAWRCSGMERWEGSLEELLGEEGKGESWGRELAKRRKERENAQI